MMQGLSMSSIKKHSSLIPLYFFLALGMGASVFYTARLAIKNPDVSWDKKNNPLPNDAYATKQYKFYSPNIDYKNLPDPRPKF